MRGGPSEPMERETSPSVKAYVRKKFSTLAAPRSAIPDAAELLFVHAHQNLRRNEINYVKGLYGAVD